MNRRRIQMLRNMIAEIPANRINLNQLFMEGSSDYPPARCGAVACLAGWAWLYPPFIQEGIRSCEGGGISAAIRFFDVPGSLFYQNMMKGSHKRAALVRLDCLLKEYKYAKAS